jgi:trans-2-enoyl-CoA reductase
VNRRAVAASASIVLLLAMPFSVMVAKGAHNGALNRCDRLMPDNAWGYTTKWDWRDRAWICKYEGRDYSPTGLERRISVTDLL